MTVSVQFINGIDEELSGISLRKRRDTGANLVVFLFEDLAALKKGRSFTNKIETLSLQDEEGNIQVTPSSMKFIFADDEHDLSKAECSFEVNTKAELDRVMRFLHRYADSHGFEFQSK
jgi:photosystem II Psb28-2 protein